MRRVEGVPRAVPVHASAYLTLHLTRRTQNQTAEHHTGDDTNFEL